MSKRACGRHRVDRHLLRDRVRPEGPRSYANRGETRRPSPIHVPDLSASGRRHQCGVRAHCLHQRVDHDPAGDAWCLRLVANHRRSPRAQEPAGRDRPGALPDPVLNTEHFALRIATQAT